jgi:hypothetical protein
MTIKIISKICTLTFAGFLIIITSYAQAPYKSALEGEVTNSSGFSLGNCGVSKISAKYSISTLVGEPTVFVNLKWKNASNSSTDCLGNESFNVLVKIYSNYSSSYYYILADGAIGLIPNGDYTWGENPLAGSPNWDKLLIKDPIFRNPNRNYEFTFVAADYAKSIWQYGFSVSAVVLYKSGREYYIK